MAKKQPPSDLHELMKLLRRIVVLAVAAYGLARGMPYLPLLVRLAILWAVLYICSGLLDVVFRRLSHRAQLSFVASPSEPEGDVAAVEKAGSR